MAVGALIFVIEESIRTSRLAYLLTLATLLLVAAGVEIPYAVLKNWVVYGNVSGDKE